MVRTSRSNDIIKISNVLRKQPPINILDEDLMEDILKSDTYMKGFYDEVRFLYDISHILLHDDRISFFGDSGSEDFNLTWYFFLTQTFPYLLAEHFKLSSEEEMGIRAIITNMFSEEPNEVVSYYAKLIDSNKEVWYANKNRINDY